MILYEVIVNFFLTEYTTFPALELEHLYCSFLTENRRDRLKNNPIAEETYAPNTIFNCTMIECQRVKTVTPVLLLQIQNFKQHDFIATNRD